MTPPALTFTVYVVFILTCVNMLRERWYSTTSVRQSVCLSVQIHRQLLSSSGPSFWISYAKTSVQNSKDNIINGALNIGVGKICVFDGNSTRQFHHLWRDTHLSAEPACLRLHGHLSRPAVSSIIEVALVKPTLVAFWHVCQRTTSNIGIPTNNSIINWMKQ